MTSTQRIRFAIGLALGIGVWASASYADDRESYGYVRAVTGDAQVLPAGTGIGETVEVNRPLGTGDRLQLARDTNLELLLPDRNHLRVGGGSDLTLDRMAFSGDATDRITVLRLRVGDLQLSVTDQALGDELPRIELANATVYLQDIGWYLVSTDGAGWSEVTVRQGYAEVVTERGSAVIRADERATLDGDEAEVEVQRAGTESALERWARRQEAGGNGDRLARVDSSLAYAAAELDNYGSWVEIDDSWAWRPQVAASWRPYWQGRWHATPSGLTWVSYEPWGWAPYHYGSWCNVPRYGWVWRPGYVYSPAWVYWYWTNDYAGWCPIGYYSQYYGHYRPGGSFQAGLYGWAGGSWGFYADWVFSPIGRICNRDQVRGLRLGTDLGRELVNTRPYGLVTTDTRGLRRDDFRPGARPLIRLQETTRTWSGSLPTKPLRDITDFIARKPQLTPEVTEVVFRDGGNHVGTRGTPLDAGWSPRRPLEGDAPKPIALAPRDSSTPRTGGSGWRVSPPPTRLPGDSSDADSGSVAPRGTKPNQGPTTRTRLNPGWSTPEAGWHSGPGIAPPPAPSTKPESSPDVGVPPLALDPRQNWRQHRPEAGSGQGQGRQETSPIGVPGTPRSGHEGWQPQPLAPPSNGRDVPAVGYELPRPQSERPPVLRLVPSARRDVGSNWNSGQPAPRTYSPTQIAPVTSPPGSFQPGDRSPAASRPRPAPSWSAPVVAPPPASLVAPPTPRSSPVTQRGTTPRFEPRGSAPAPTGNGTGKPGWTAPPTPPPSPEAPPPKAHDRDRDG